MTRPSLGTVMVITPVSGKVKVECDVGVCTATSSGFLNTVVDMKKINSKKATSTIGVMSILIEILRFFGAAILVRPVKVR